MICSSEFYSCLQQNPTNKTRSQGGLNIREIINILESTGIKPNSTNRSSLVKLLCHQKRLGKIPGMPAVKKLEITKIAAATDAQPIGISAAASMGAQAVGIPASGAGADLPRVVSERVLLGSGSSGNVYKQGDMVIKQLKIPLDNLGKVKKRVQNFVKEFMIAKRINPKCDSAIKTTCASDITIEFTMPYITKSQTLQTFINEQLELSVYEKLLLCIQLIDLLQILIDAHIIHNDIKPANLLINTYGEVLLMDFDLADQWVDGIPFTITVSGTPRYIPPLKLIQKGTQYESFEQAHSGDIWSIGITCYYVLYNGKVPWQSKLKKGLNAEIINYRRSVTLQNSFKDYPFLAEMITESPNTIRALELLLQQIQTLSGDEAVVATLTKVFDAKKESGKIGPIQRYEQVN